MFGGGWGDRAEAIPETGKRKQDSPRMRGFTEKKMRSHANPTLDRSLSRDKVKYCASGAFCGRCGGGGRQDTADRGGAAGAHFHSDTSSLVRSTHHVQRLS